MSATAFAQTTINGLVYTLNNEGTEYTVTGYTSDLPNDFEILSVVEGKPVTTLASRLFQNNKSITSCVMPNSISKLLGDGEFNGCEALTSVTLSNQLPKITNYMFCSTALEEITIPASVTTIDYEAFCAWTDKSKASLKRVIFEDGSKLDQLGDECFKNREGLQSVNLEACRVLRRFAGQIFMNCKALKTITVPANLSLIQGANQFNGSGLETITFEPGCKVTSLGQTMFQNCTSLKSLTIPAAVKTINNYVTGWTACLNTVTFEEGSQLETIGEGAFRSNLFKELDLSVCHNLKSIGLAAFRGCPNLEKVYLPESVNSMQNGCFASCGKMKYLVMNYAGDWNDINFNGGTGHFTEGADYTIYINENATNVPATFQSRTMTSVAPITISATGYATYFNSNAIDLPSTLEAAYVEGVTDRMIDYNWAYASHDAVPAATGVVARGAEGTYTPALVTTAAFAGTNLLNGSDEAATTVGGDKYYKLSLDAENTPGTLGFYWGAENGAAFQNGAHKAYLALTTAQAKAIKGFRFDGTFDEDSETTGIKIYENASTSSVQAYNLAGQRVTSTGSATGYKGIVIVNGKKYVK